MKSKPSEANYVGSLPPGQYYLGDPCYVIATEFWDDFCKAIDAADEEYPEYPGYNGVIFEFQGHKVFVTATNYGDGSYLDNLGNKYGVDAGIIGLIPEALCLGKTIESSPGHRYQTKSTPIDIWVDKGRWIDEKKIVVGARVITT